MKLWTLSVWELRKIPETPTTKAEMFDFLEEQVEQVLLVGKKRKDALNQYYRDLTRNGIKIKTLCDSIWLVNKKYIYLDIEKVESVRFLHADLEDDFYKVKLVKDGYVEPNEKEEEETPKFDGNPFLVTQKVMEEVGETV